MIVLDASALLALLFDEPGARHVRDVMSPSIMTTVNLAEVLDRFARDGHDVRAVSEQLRLLPVRWIDFDRDLAERAAVMKPETAVRGLSLADRACLALAQRSGEAVLTADRAWAEVDVGVDVQLIR